MADELTIRAVLVAASAFTSLLGGAVTPRLWDQVVPPGTPTPVPRPYVTMTVIADVPERDASTAPGIASFIVQFDIYAPTKADAKTVLTQLRAALNGAGYVDGEVIARDLPSGDSTLKRISSEWQFWLTR